VCTAASADEILHSSVQKAQKVAMCGKHYSAVAVLAQSDNGTK